MSNEQVYTFLPFLRQGIIGKITESDDLGTASSYPPTSDAGEKRAIIGVDLHVNDSVSADVSKDVLLAGARDVTGINPEMIIRTAPIDGENSFLPNFICFLDFFDEDFPWRYTPAKPNGTPQDQQKLRPWLALVVLKETEFNDKIISDAPSPSIEILQPPAEVFPNEKQIWAWAHVQMNANLGGAVNNDFSTIKSGVQELLDKHSERAVSRILCPRKLDDNTIYHAFLIPTFEAGRLAGLGRDNSEINKFEPSWKHAETSNYATEYPVYYRWKFSTGASGDFESLVKKLAPAPYNPRLGKMPMDIHTPNHPWLDNLADPGIIEFEGVLQQPAEDPTNTPVTPPEFKEALMDLLNLSDDLQSNQTGMDSVDPVIAPPIYGRWHALITRLETHYNWLNELNLDPRYRTAAGIGAEVIRARQNEYMEMAWQQIQAVNEANRKLALLQSSMTFDYTLFQKHYSTLPAGEFISVTGAVQNKIYEPNAGQTVYATVKESNVPNEMFDASFRADTRPGAVSAQVSGLHSGGFNTGFVSQVADSSVTVVANYALPSTQSELVALSTMDLLPSTVVSATTTINFVLTKPGTAIPTSWFAGTPSAHFNECRAACEDVLTAKNVTSASYTADTVGSSLNVNNVRYAVEDAIDPDLTHARVASANVLVNGVSYVQARGNIKTIMAAPTIDLPMYKPMSQISPDFLVPNFAMIQENSLALLETNNKVIEAYMVGLNYEFARELIWNEYPTDQRGSYFRNFWDSNFIIPDINEDTDGVFSPAQLAEIEKARDITPIHTWHKSSSLGSHNTGMNSAASSLVLVIKGDLIQKFPNLLIYAQKAVWQTSGGGFDQTKVRELGSERKDPSFFARVDPDVILVGFDLTREEVEGVMPPDDNNPGWYFVLQEKAGDIRFGLDESSVPPPGEIALWSDLTWQHLDEGNPTILNLNHIDLIENAPALAPNDPPDLGITWGLNSSNMAYIMYQKPVQVAIHASNLLSGL